jgi:hypothetical protein
MAGNTGGNTTGSGKEATPLPPEMKPRELLRWTWRQLTSMRTALVLLFLLALAAVPGSVIPQTAVDAYAVSQWQEDHPKLTPLYEKLGMFSVFESPWFSAIYLLLAVSLVGCILPRTRVYWKALRAAPPAAPRNLTRLPDSASLRRRATLRPSCSSGHAAYSVVKRYRTVVAPTGTPSAPSAATCARPATCSSTSRCSSCSSASRWAAVGLQGRRDRGEGRLLHQHPDAVRRLLARPADPRRRAGRLRLQGRRLRHRVAHRRPARGHGPQVRRRPHLVGRQGRQGDLRPAGQPPADDRRHRACS